ncbi:hypothetical protein EYF80_023188 [Liparis tanakae]|uniref:Uncharacterized protein n=1 Tax=Liparis tanakae TaxID=230148 RepID=A0A4Z2HNV4_9TELE|nr:hypothetical protein EYF80_023188 [Liparis tanakae]
MAPGTDALWAQVASSSLVLLSLLVYAGYLGSAVSGDLLAMIGQLIVWTVRGSASIHSVCSPKSPHAEPE